MSTCHVPALKCDCELRNSIVTGTLQQSACTSISIPTVVTAARLSMHHVCLSVSAIFSSTVPGQTWHCCRDWGTGILQAEACQLQTLSLPEPGRICLFCCACQRPSDRLTSKCQRMFLKPVAMLNSCSSPSVCVMERNIMWTHWHFKVFIGCNWTLYDYFEGFRHCCWEIKQSMFMCVCTCECMLCVVDKCIQSGGLYL